MKNGRYAAGYWDRVMCEGADAQLLKWAKDLPASDLTDDMAAARTVIGVLYQLIQSKAQKKKAKGDEGPPVDPLEVVKRMFDGWGRIAQLAIAHYRLNDRQADLLVDGMANVLGELRATMGDVSDDALVFREESDA